jgi:hypothetical protein
MRLPNHGLAAGATILLKAEDFVLVIRDTIVAV